MSIVITCLGEKERLQILEGARDQGASDEVIRTIAEFPVCTGGASVEVSESKRGGAKKPRKASGYQKYIGSCMKKGNIKSFGAAAGVMKSCAVSWKKLSPQQKEEWKRKEN